MFTSEQLDALQAAAEAATPGPWGADHNGDPNDFSEWFGATVLSAPKFLDGGAITATHLAEVFERPADASFIAAANPAVVLEFVAAYRDVLAQVDELRKMLDSYTREYPQECNKRVAAEAARDAALSRIARVEAVLTELDDGGKSGVSQHSKSAAAAFAHRRLADAVRAALTEGEPSE